jgi:hypothetical protein
VDRQTPGVNHRFPCPQDPSRAGSHVQTIVLASPRTSCVEEGGIANVVRGTCISVSSRLLLSTAVLEQMHAVPECSLANAKRLARGVH